MLGEGLLSVRTARKTTLHVSFETFISLLDCQRCNVLDPRRRTRCERYFD